MSETKQQEATTEVETSDLVAPEMEAATDAPAGEGAPRRGGRGGDRRGGRNDRRPRRQARPERVRPEFDQKIISIRRVTRVMAGGRRFSFSVAMVIGERRVRSVLVSERQATHNSLLKRQSVTQSAT